MNNPIFVVGDRVRMRHPAPYSLNPTGTVTLVFGTARGYYDVKFDTASELRVVHASALEHSTAKLNREPPTWTDDHGHCHVAPNMCDLPLGLQAAIKRMEALIARGTATEEVDIMLCVLLTRVSNDEIDRRPYGEKRHFVTRWFDNQKRLFVVSA